jgi:hypothetical protein
LHHNTQQAAIIKQTNMPAPIAVIALEVGIPPPPPASSSKISISASFSSIFVAAAIK